MTDRQLDALFAEKVLGLANDGECFQPDDEWVKRNAVDAFVLAGTRVPAYTSDLTAAWAGASQWKGCGVWHNPDRNTFTGSIPADYGNSYDVYTAQAGTPACALVLACLKAVGVEV